MLEELSNPECRPPQAPEPMPSSALNTHPADQLALDKNVLGEVPRQSRRGGTSGLSGTRIEYLRLCLEDDSSFNLLHEARAGVPEEIVHELALSKLSAMLKPNGRISGIAAGDSFGRLAT